MKTMQNTYPKNAQKRKLWEAGEWDEEGLRLKSERNEKGLCGWCMSKLKGRKISWCNWECSKQFYEKYRNVLHDWNKVKKKIIERDKSICQICKTKTEKPEVDHIKAIVNGGDEWDENNLRVLCHPCHKVKTRSDLRAMGSWSDETILAQRGIDERKAANLNKFLLASPPQTKVRGFRGEVS